MYITLNSYIPVFIIASSGLCNVHTTWSLFGGQKTSWMNYSKCCPWRIVQTWQHGWGAVRMWKHWQKKWIVKLICVCHFIPPPPPYTLISNLLPTFGGTATCMKHKINGICQVYCYHFYECTYICPWNNTDISRIISRAWYNLILHIHIWMLMSTNICQLPSIMFSLLWMYLSHHKYYPLSLYTIIIWF
jgi:hypothetical protein